MQVKLAGCVKGLQRGMPASYVNTNVASATLCADLLMLTQHQLVHSKARDNTSHLFCHEHITSFFQPHNFSSGLIWISLCTIESLQLWPSSAESNVCIMHAVAAHLASVREGFAIFCMLSSFLQGVMNHMLVCRSAMCTLAQPS